LHQGNVDNDIHETFVFPATTWTGDLHLQIIQLGHGVSNLSVILVHILVLVYPLVQARLVESVVALRYQVKHAQFVVTDGTVVICILNFFVKILFFFFFRIWVWVWLIWVFIWVLDWLWIEFLVNWFKFNTKNPNDGRKPEYSFKSVFKCSNSIEDCHQTPEIHIFIVEFCILNLIFRKILIRIGSVSFCYHRSNEEKYFA